jgi:hypothetical protein
LLRLPDNRLKAGVSSASVGSSLHAARPARDGAKTAPPAFRMKLRRVSVMRLLLGCDVEGSPQKIRTPYHVGAQSPSQPWLRVVTAW